jgi:hypothetical protein
MREKYPAPNFGFDTHAGAQIQKTVEDPWTLMLGVVGAKESQTALWQTINKMNDIKRIYNILVKQKLMAQPKSIRSREECRKLFQSYEASCQI